MIRAKTSRPGPCSMDNVNAQKILGKVVKSRGVDVELTPDEHLVYGAMIKEGRMHGGIARLYDPASPVWHFFIRN